jgi:hypothetical protein
MLVTRRARRGNDNRHYDSRHQLEIMSERRKSYVERLEAMGVEQVRLRLQNRVMEDDLVAPAKDWLLDKAFEQAEQAKRAAQGAKWAAWTAGALAVIGIIVGMLR